MKVLTEQAMLEAIGSFLIKRHTFILVQKADMTANSPKLGLWTTTLAYLELEFRILFSLLGLGLTNANYLRSTTIEAKTKSQISQVHPCVLKKERTYWDCWAGVWWQRVCCSSHTPARCRCPPVAPRGTGAWAQCFSSPAAWLLPLIQPQPTLPAQTKHKHCI